MDRCAKNVPSSPLVAFIISVKRETKSQRLHLKVKGQVIWEERARRCEIVSKKVFEPEAVGKQYDCQGTLRDYLRLAVMNLNTEY